MQRYEPDSSSSEEDESSSEEESDDGQSRPSSFTSAPISDKLNSLAEAEFRSEVMASLDRAWSEGHAVENAAVELKTLRMASNVPLRKVRESIIGFLLDKMETGPGETRDKVKKVVERWGSLIDAIGGIDAVETIEILQVCASVIFEAIFAHLSL